MSANKTNCDACDKNKDALPQRDIASFASDGNLSGALGASFGLAVDSGTAGKIGNRLGGTSPGKLMSFIETPGSNKQKNAMSESQKKDHLINSVGLGNFSLNSTLEQGLVSSISGARGESSDFLKGNKTGASLMAASALGIDVPGGDMLGIGPGDSPMFKVFKLAAFGLRLLCAGLKDKQRGGPGGYNSDTEEALGLLLSLSINLDLFARLKAIFDKLTNLKFNFSSFDLGDLNIADVLFNLCDWVENMEYGSDTIDTFRKSFGGDLTNKGLTEAVGKKLIGEGTYDTFARNDFGFDQQFKSIAGDVDMLKCDACNLGKTDIKIAQGNKDLVNLEFDARTGLKRERGYETPNGSVLGDATQPPLSDTKELTLEEKRRRGEEFSQEELDAYEATLDERGKARMKTLTPAAQKGYLQGGLRTQKQNEKIQADLKRDLDELEKQESSSTEDLFPYDPKKNLEITEEELSKETISSQVSETQKTKIPNLSEDELVDKKNTKTVKKQLGISEDRKIPKIESTMGETKTGEEEDLFPYDPKKNLKVKTSDDLQEQIKSKSNTSHTFSQDKKDETKSGISYESSNKNIVYDTYTDENGDIKEDTYVQNENDEFEKTKSKVKYNKPTGGPPAEPDADEVTSFHTGETIKREELQGTILEDADMNAVGMLHPNDIENLKNNEEVQKVLEDADKKHTEKFNTEIEKTENLILEQQSGGIIFGVQLPTVLNGNQIVLNSERVLMSAKTQEFGIFSKRKFFVTTDDEITFNSKRRFVVKTDIHASIEAPSVHLGLYTTRNHPSLKGDCVKWWLDDLCDWLSSHTHNDPYVTTSVPVQQGSLAALKARTPTLLSERIFISG